MKQVRVHKLHEPYHYFLLFFCRKTKREENVISSFFLPSYTSLLSTFIIFLPFFFLSFLLPFFLSFCLGFFLSNFSSLFLLSIFVCFFLSCLLASLLSYFFSFYSLCLISVYLYFYLSSSFLACIFNFSIFLLPCFTVLSVGGNDKCIFQWKHTMRSCDIHPDSGIALGPGDFKDEEEKGELTII